MIINLKNNIKMKKTILVCAMALLSTVSFSQKFTYTDSSLNTMTKMQLTDVYLDQVIELAYAVPYSPFTIGISDTTQGDIDIPVSRYIKNKREDILKSSKNYSTTMRKQLYELVPYSDKKDMVRAILYLQKVNARIKNNQVD